MKFFQLSPAPYALALNTAGAPGSCVLGPSPLHCTSSFQPSIAPSEPAAGLVCGFLCACVRFLWMERRARAKNQGPPVPMRCAALTARDAALAAMREMG
uniref:Uncharacterized protein n=1 Tax=Knipowitschia caucasica TaxID=637954 RepID=A0AAV2JHQ4_KNICA